MKRFVFIALMFAALVLAGCAAEEVYQPVEIDPEVDVCDVCNMNIAHEFYATELIAKDGKVYKFDDLGCLMKFVNVEKTLSKDEIAKQYVRDVDTGEWVELEDAYYVYYDEIWTPMAHGVISFKEKESAEKYIEKIGNGELYDYEKLLKHEFKYGKHKHKDHGEHGHGDQQDGGEQDGHEDGGEHGNHDEHGEHDE